MPSFIRHLLRQKERQVLFLLSLAMFTGAVWSTRAIIGSTLQRKITQAVGTVPKPTWTYETFKSECVNSNNVFNLLSARRNHDSVFSVDGDTLYNVAGRGVHNIEAIHLPTCEQRIVASSDYLDMNHISAVSSGQKIFLSNGLHGTGVDAETTSEHFVIVDTETREVIESNKMRVPRGAGAATMLRNFRVKKSALTAAESEVDLATLPSEWSEDLICTFGGSCKLWITPLPDQHGLNQLPRRDSR